MKKRIRTVTLALVAIFALGIAGAPPALAEVKRSACFTWRHQTATGLSGPLTACAQLNTEFPSDLRIEARLVWSISGVTTGEWRIDVDYVHLLLNGNLVAHATAAPATRELPPNGQFDTGWILTDGPNNTWKAVARFRFRHLHGTDHTSGWQVLRTTGWICCG
jgi:hypothetical protein